MELQLLRLQHSLTNTNITMRPRQNKVNMATKWI